MLESIKQNIERLIAAYETAKAENVTLKADLENVVRELDSCKEKIQTLNKQIDSLTLKAAFTSTASDIEGAKAKIDRMIREIDRCISMMEK